MAQVHPLKRDFLSGHKEDPSVPSISCLQEPHAQHKGADSLKVKGQGKVYHANTEPKQGAGAPLISDKADIGTRKIAKYKEGHHIIIKESILQEDINNPNCISPY